MNPQRRAVLATAVGASLLAATARAATNAVMTEPTKIPAPELDPIPSLPATPSPGKPGDFDFLTGKWRITHRQPKADEWIEFSGEATVHGILAGIGSVEELRIPARDFSGMGLRLLDVEKKRWSDFWVNAKSGVLTTPGMTGSFEKGAGIFVSEDTEDGKHVLYAGIWDRITPKSCRWRQAWSRDGGKSWTQTWLMDWRRA